MCHRCVQVVAALFSRSHLILLIFFLCSQTVADPCPVVQQEAKSRWSDLCLWNQRASGRLLTHQVSPGWPWVTVCPGLEIRVNTALAHGNTEVNKMRWVWIQHSVHYSASTWWHRFFPERKESRSPLLLKQKIRILIWNSMNNNHRWAETLIFLILALSQSRNRTNWIVKNHINS